MKKAFYLLSLLIVAGLTSCQNGDKQDKLQLIAGTGSPGFADGAHAELFKPIRLAVYKNNSILFADINNHAIRFVDQNGDVTTIAGGPDKKGFADGNADTAKFSNPHGVAYTPKTNTIFVASASNHVIREITEAEDGTFTVKTIAGIPGETGYKDGSVDSAMFNSPHGVVVRDDGSLVVIDIGNAKLRLIKDGMVSTIAGNTDNDPLKVDFFYPIDLALDGDDVLIADAGNHKIFRIKPGISAETVQLNDTLNTPHGISTDENGSIYIADMGTNRILRIDKEGNFFTLVDATTDTTSVSHLKKPAAVLYNKSFLWIADLNNHQLKRLDLRD